jgi:hypothetical protein
VREARFLRRSIIPVLAVGALAVAGCSSSGSSSGSTPQSTGSSSSSSAGSSSGTAGLELLGAQSYYQQIFYGAALILAITVPKVNRERIFRRRRMA